RRSLLTLSGCTFDPPSACATSKELLAERGVTVSDETVREWCARFDPAHALELRRRRPPHLTSGMPMGCRLRVSRHSPWLAVDKPGVVVDIVVQERRDQVAAFSPPRVMITEEVRSDLTALRGCRRGPSIGGTKRTEQSSQEFALADASE